MAYWNCVSPRLPYIRSNAARRPVVEKGLVVAQRLDVGLALLVEEDGVEHADGGAVQREGGRVERKTNFGSGDRFSSPAPASARPT